MSFLKKFKTVFLRLIISHLIIVVLLSISIGAVTTIYFTGVLESQIKATDKQLVFRMTESAKQQAYEKVDKIWVQTVKSNNLVNRFFTLPSSVSTVELYNLFLELDSLQRQNYELISDIEIYSKEANIFISTKQGVKYISDNDEVKPYKAFKSVVDKGLIRSEWLLPDEGEKNVTLFRTFPYVKNLGINFKGYLAISINKNYVNSLITLDNDDAENEIFVINNNKVIVNSNKDKNIGTVISDEYIDKIVTANGSFFESLKINNKKCIVSASKIGDTNLTLIRKVPFNVFYKKITALQVINFIICVIFSLIGFFLSFYLVKVIHTPLNNIINNIKNMVTKSNEKDEYSLISHTISNLVTKVNVLEENIETNISLIKDNVINTILTDPDRKMLRSRLNLIYPPFEFENYTTIIIALLNSEIERLGIKKFEYYKYDLIEYIDNYKNPNLILKSASIGSKNIGIILNSKISDNDVFLNFISDIQNYLKNKHDISPYFGVGDWELQIENLNSSYVKASTALKYTYIYPERKVFMIENYIKKDFSEISMDKSNIFNFYDALKSGDKNEVTKSLDDLKNSVRNNDCSYTVCEYQINEYVNAFVKFTLDQNINIKMIVNENIYLQVQSMENINEFETWLIGRAEILFDIRANKTIVDNSITIEKAIKFIEENLSKDISLSLVAQKVYITPPYLSKMFKKETGMNFNAYITEKRLETAKDLLLSTELSVNQIAQKVGFNSATYLIKRFKERFGDTPVNYKKSITDE